MAQMHASWKNACDGCEAMDANIQMMCQMCQSPQIVQNLRNCITYGKPRINVELTNSIVYVVLIQNL